MNCTPKSWTFPPTRQGAVFYDPIYIKYQAVFHYLRIRSRQRTAQTITASSASAYAAGYPYIRKTVSAHLNTPSSLNLKKPSPVAYRTQPMQTA